MYPLKKETFSRAKDVEKFESNKEVRSFDASAEFYSPAVAGRLTSFETSISTRFFSPLGPPCESLDYRVIISLPTQAIFQVIVTDCGPNRRSTSNVCFISCTKQEPE
jgi:hypothetical protein